VPTCTENMLRLEVSFFEGVGIFPDISLQSFWMICFVVGSNAHHKEPEKTSAEAERE